MLYHISKYKLLTPMIPRIPKSKFEDQTTPRICFSTSIQGCLIGVNENKDISGEVFHVYGLETSNYITPTKEQVKDVDITGEVWVTEKCSPKHLYDIKVIGKKSEKTEKINGKMFKVPVWDYEKIEGIQESEVLNEQINSKTILDKARDIMEKMNDIEYGSVYADGRKSKRDRNDWYDDSNKFCPQPVLSVLKHKMGHCIDQSELERYYFKKANIKHKVFSMFPERGSNMYHNHTFLVFFDENDTPYWFDHAWYSERGIHKGESLNELFKKICDKKRKADPQNDPENAERFKTLKYEIFEVPQKSCLSWDDYVEWVWRQKLVYKG